MNYTQARDYLYGLRYHGAKYGIDRMAGFAQALGHPERRYPLVHVAGTNGKGSTCALLESVYRRAGYRTGLFTSPHLVRQGERIQVNREILHEDAIAAYTTELKALAEQCGREDPDLHPSFFEFMVGMAFLHFAREKVDVALIETGLGGRLDATNIVEPEASVITSISFDHTDILGDTLEKIAFEKAGILKPGRPAILGHLPPEAEKTIRDIAAERGCTVHSIAEAFPQGNYPQTNLPGAYQQWNAATAHLVVDTLQKKLPVGEKALHEGLLHADWAGRWDARRLDDGRRIILDASHNPEGAEALRENLRGLVAETGKKPVILAGTLGEARAAALMPAIAPFAREIHLLRPQQPRALAPEVLRGYLPADYTGPVHLGGPVRDLFPAPGLCTAGEPGDVLVATGSIYLIGEVLEALLHETPVGGALLQD